MRILLIEDETDIIAFLKPALESECYAIDAVTDGDMGIRFATLHNYDLIILDIMLPKVPGLDVCQAIRKAGKLTPILMLSAVTTTIKKVEALNFGADDYLTKPFSFPELLARIAALLRRPPTLKPMILTHGPLQINLQKRSVTMHQSPVLLTKKEFMLLSYMMKHQDSVLSRSDLMEHVWDISADPFSNTIESHIMSIRKKLGDKSIITTISGRGYVITTGAR